MDLKKRIADIVAVQLCKQEPHDLKQIRFWRCVSREKLLGSFKEIEDSPDQEMKSSSSVAGAEAKMVEENSGVEFPGESLEPMVGTIYTF
jgi:hypothetical protein